MQVKMHIIIFILIFVIVTSCNVLIKDKDLIDKVIVDLIDEEIQIHGASQED